MGKHLRNSNFLETQRFNSDDLTSVHLKLKINELNKREQALVKERNELAHLLHLDTLSQNKSIQELIDLEKDFEPVLVNSQEQYDLDNLPKWPNFLAKFIQFVISYLKFLQRSIRPKTNDEEIIRILSSQKLEYSYEEIEILRRIDFRNNHYGRWYWDFKKQELNRQINVTVWEIERLFRVLENRTGELRPKVKRDYLIRNIRNDLRSILQFLFKPLDEPFELKTI